ncbi:MAG: hypothetical protein V5A55_02745 [Halovenus sp.]
MGLFQSLGQQTERLKQKFTGDSRYECLSCKDVLDDDYETCPNCGSDAVVPAE